MKIKLKKNLFRAKSVLNKVSDTSYTYSQLERDFRPNDITDEKIAKQVLEAYNELINDLKLVINNYEPENEKQIE
jgi:hypothetical protein